MRRIALTALLLAAGIAVLAQEGNALFRTLRVGLKVRYKSTRKTLTEAKGDWRKSGGERTKGKEKTLEIVERDWTETVLGVKHGEGHLLQRTYASSTKGTAKSVSTPGKPEKTDRTSLNGKTMFLRRAGISIGLQVKQGSLEGEEEGELKFLEQLYVIVPDGPVKQGSSWEPDGTKVAKTLFDGIWDETNFKSKAKCTYKGNDKIGGRPCAKIALALGIDVAQFGSIPEIHIEYVGNVFVSLDNGVILGYDLTGPLRMKGRSKENDAEVEWILEGSRTESLRGEIQEEGGELEGGSLEIPS